jgi:hypothetical protein
MGRLYDTPNNEAAAVTELAADDKNNAHLKALEA